VELFYEGAIVLLLLKEAKQIQTMGPMLFYFILRNEIGITPFILTFQD